MKTLAPELGKSHHLETPPDGSRFRGVGGFCLSVVSAALCLYTILSLHHAATKDMGPLEGGSAFSANMPLVFLPMLASLVGVVLGGIAAIFTILSIRTRRTGRSFSIFHLLSLALLVPACFQVLMLGAWLLRIAEA